jgi:preprotein translocase subunit SecF
MMSNPMANLGVATQAAEMQAEEADIALANTLDTLRATGAGAGGATALAQMALKSKQGISASIETQEATNQKLRAQGEQNLQQRQVAEEQRIQGVEMNDSIRLQNAESQGRMFEFNTKETRDNNDLAQQYGQLANAEANQAQARASGVNALAGGLQGIASLGMSGAFGEFPPKP